MVGTSPASSISCVTSSSPLRPGSNGSSPPISRSASAGTPRASRPARKRAMADDQVHPRDRPRTMSVVELRLYSECRQRTQVGALKVSLRSVVDQHPKRRYVNEKS
jgi:hypothetical protein